MRAIFRGLAALTATIAGSTFALENGRLAEFYNSKLDHYFYTVAESDEARWVERGGAGTNWAKTGWVFIGGNALILAGNTNLCRFYGSLQPGPNSHFYTMDVIECEGLKQLAAKSPADLPRWNFEGLAGVGFFTYVRASENAATGSNGCSLQGSTGIFYPRILRFYNNGFARGKDSNHRFVSETALAEIADMNSRGWINEGVAMCGTQIEPPR